VIVSADGKGLVSGAGGLLASEVLRVTGLGAGLSRGLAPWRRDRAVHDPGKIIGDLALAVALGGDCLADIAVLRAEPELYGPVASDPVVSRTVAALAADPARALKAIRAARAAARERAWALAGSAAPGVDGGLITVDLDATLVTSYSEKENARPTWKKTFGFHPLTAFADHGPDGGGNRWRSCSGRVTPGRTPPPTTSRRRSWRWPSCPARCGAGCLSAPIPAAAPTTS
jgi:Transposase DDE domain group 1